MAPKQPTAAGGRLGWDEPSLITPEPKVEGRLWRSTPTFMKYGE